MSIHLRRLIRLSINLLWCLYTLDDLYVVLLIHRSAYTPINPTRSVQEHISQHTFLYSWIKNSPTTTYVRWFTYYFITVSIHLIFHYSVNTPIIQPEVCRNISLSTHTCIVGDKKNTPTTTYVRWFIHPNLSCSAPWETWLGIIVLRRLIRPKRGTVSNR